MKKIQIIKVKLILLLFGINISTKKLIEISEKQIKKGLKKYGHSLKECPFDKFDWKLMAAEELIDFIQYVYKLKKKF